MMAQQPVKTKSGTVRITDSSVFPFSTTIAAALVEVDPGGMRELHWHPNTNEGSIISRVRPAWACSARPVRRAPSISRPTMSAMCLLPWGIISRTPALRRCAFWNKSSTYADMSLHQWMALTPPELVEAHLNLGVEVMEALRKKKTPVVPA
jgi:oxalate decarboxylase